MTTQVRYWHGGIKVGNIAEALQAMVGTLEYLDSGSFRNVYINAARSVVYKVEDATSTLQDGADNTREYEAERLLAECGCAARAYAVPCTLYTTGTGRTIIAMPYYPRPGYAAFIGTREQFVRNIRAHNAHDHAPVIADMLEDNYRTDARGNIRITDLNLDVAEYQFLVETETTGRL